MVTQKSRDLSIKNGDFTKKQWEYHGILVGYIYILYIYILYIYIYNIYIYIYNIYIYNIYIYIQYIYIYNIYTICIYIYMMIDLKVLVTSFSCEDRSCYAGNPSRTFFFCEFAKENFQFAKVSRKLDIVNPYHCIHYSLLRATTSCRPGVRQENGTTYLPFPS